MTYLYAEDRDATFRVDNSLRKQYRRLVTEDTGVDEEMAAVAVVVVAEVVEVAALLEVAAEVVLG